MKTKSLCAAALLAVLGFQVAGTTAFAADPTPEKLATTGTVTIEEGKASKDDPIPDPNGGNKPVPNPGGDLGPEVKPNPVSGSLMITHASTLNFGTVKSGAGAVKAVAKNIKMNTYKQDEAGNFIDADNKVLITKDGDYMAPTEDKTGTYVVLDKTGHYYKENGNLVLEDDEAGLTEAKAAVEAIKGNLVGTEKDKDGKDVPITETAPNFVSFTDIRTDESGYTVKVQMTKQFTNGDKKLDNSTITFNNPIAYTIAKDQDTANAAASELELTSGATIGENGASAEVVSAAENKGKGAFTVSFGKVDGGEKDSAKSVVLDIPQATGLKMVKGSYTADILWSIEPGMVAEGTEGK